MSESEALILLRRAALLLRQAVELLADDERPHVPPARQTTRQTRERLARILHASNGMTLTLLARRAGVPRSTAVAHLLPDGEGGWRLRT